MGLREDIESAINCNSAENGSNTPDFILAEFVRGCLVAFDAAVNEREAWYGRDPKVGPCGMRSGGPTLLGDPVSPTPTEDSTDGS